MEQMTITAKIQVSVSETNKPLLDYTMSVYRDACNYVRLFQVLCKHKELT